MLHQSVPCIEWVLVPRFMTKYVDLLFSYFLRVSTHILCFSSHFFASSKLAVVQKLVVWMLAVVTAAHDKFEQCVLFYCWNDRMHLRICDLLKMFCFANIITRPEFCCCGFSNEFCFLDLGTALFMICSMFSVQINFSSLHSLDSS